MKKARSKVLAGLLTLAVAISFMPSTAFAASKSMKAYDEVIKDGNTVYCCTYGGIYKVKLKNGRISSGKRLVQGGVTEHCYPTDMKKKGKYIYYMAYSDGNWSQLCRVKTSSGKIKSLADGMLTDYAISGSRIYYRYESDTGKVRSRVMTLSGKSKKKTSTKAKTLKRHTNAKGYRVVQEERGDYMYYWLKTPKGRDYIGRAALEE